MHEKRCNRRSKQIRHFALSLTRARRMAKSTVLNGGSERSPEFAASIDCSRLSCVSNKNQKYAHSAGFAVLALIVGVGNGWLLNLSSCHLPDTRPDPGGFID